MLFILASLSGLLGFLGGLFWNGRNLNKADMEMSMAAWENDVLRRRCDELEAALGEALGFKGERHETLF